MCVSPSSQTMRSCISKRLRSDASHVHRSHASVRPDCMPLSNAQNKARHRRAVPHLSSSAFLLLELSPPCSNKERAETSQQPWLLRKKTSERKSCHPPS